MSSDRELWQFRELFFFLAWRDVKVRYKQTALGVLWVVAQPLFTMVVFTFLFGNLAGIPSDGSPHAVFYLSALIPWTYFSTMLATVGNSLINNTGLLTKVYFPRVILPAAAALAGLLDLIVASSCLAFIMLWYGIRPTFWLLLWPFLLIPLVGLTLGFGMFLAALNVKYRDVKYAIPFAIQLWLFVTPIIYPTSFFPERYRVLLSLNPLSGIIEAFRFSLIPSRRMDWSSFWVSLAMTGGVFLIGLHYFRRTERAFADIV